MIRCVECGWSEPRGALFCGECGASLLDLETGEERNQPPFTDEETPNESPTLLGQDMNVVVDAARMTFVIPGSNRRLRLDLEEELVIGRADPASGHNPHLDLTEDEGAQKGVSRRHAVIRNTGEGVVILDRGSTNGTFLNNYCLPEGLPYPLHSGDELRFGRLLVHVFFD